MLNHQVEASSSIDFRFSFKHNTGAWTKGPWSGEEDERLIRAVQAYKERDERVSWSQVSKIVGTRSLNTCEVRWTRNLSKREHNLCDVFTDEDAHKLVNYVHGLNVDDDYLIDWTDVGAYFDNRYTPGWLRCKFQGLCKEVPSSHLCEYVDVVEQLHEIYQHKQQIEDGCTQVLPNPGGDVDVDDVSLIDDISILVSDDEDMEVVDSVIEID